MDWSGVKFLCGLGLGESKGCGCWYCYWGIWVSVLRIAFEKGSGLSSLFLSIFSEMCSASRTASIFVSPQDFAGG